MKVFDHNDTPAEGESQLVLTLTENNGVRIGATRIYLTRIKGKQIRLVFIGPRDQRIERIYRDGEVQRKEAPQAVPGVPPQVNR